MNGRGIVGLVAAVAVLASGCTPEVDAADELRDIREVLAEAPEEAEAEGDAGADAAPPDEGPAGEHDEAASAEAPEAGGELPGTSDVDVTVVPEEVTLEYVQAVLDELERIYAEALVLMMEEGELTIEITDRLGEIFTLDQSRLRTEELVAVSDEGFSGFLAPARISAYDWEVASIIVADEGCLWVEGIRSADGVLADPPTPVETFVLLEPPTAERPVEINPTPWVIAALRIGDPVELRQVDTCG